MNLKINSQAILLLLIISVFLSSCSKENSEPNEWNILEWKINNNFYKADCEGEYRECSITSCWSVPCDPVSCKFYVDSRTLSIRGGIEKDRIEIYKYKSLKIDSISKLEMYDDMTYIDYTLSEDCREYYVDSLFDSEFKITEFDTINRIIAGKFSFTAINSCVDTVKVDEGYFKLTYH